MRQIGSLRNQGAGALFPKALHGTSGWDRGDACCWGGELGEQGEASEEDGEDWATEDPMLFTSRAESLELMWAAAPGSCAHDSRSQWEAMEKMAQQKHLSQCVEDSTSLLLAHCCSCRPCYPLVLTMAIPVSTGA